MLGVEPAMIRVVAKDVGGNFGTRNNSYPEFALVGPPPVKWSDLKYGIAIEEDCNGEEAQA